MDIRITDDIMKILQEDSKVKLLEHPDFVPMDMSPLVKMPNPFPIISIGDSQTMSQSPEYSEELITIRK